MRKSLRNFNAVFTIRIFLKDVINYTKEKNFLSNFQKCSIPEQLDPIHLKDSTIAVKSAVALLPGWYCWRVQSQIQVQVHK